MDAQLRALADATRRRILNLIWDGERTASDIASYFAITRPAVSQHLKVLLEAGLVRLRAAGTRRYYRADRRALAALRGIMEAFWDDRLARLKAAAEAAEKRRKDMAPNLSVDTDNPATQRIVAIQDRIKELEQEIVGLRAEAPKEVVEDYELTDWQGGKVRLSSLFGDKDDLVLVHNMGKSCPYCTMWADGYNGVFTYVNKRAAFVVASPDDVGTQKRHAGNRGWKFPMVSSQGTALFKDMGFEGEKGDPYPGVSSFHKTGDGRIERYARASFGPGDKFCSVFSFYDLLPEEKKAG
ncbi:MAG: metalloregulator ArsR/SmtB family transcription factor [Alphaproteobacteria bacterium]